MKLLTLGEASKLTGKSKPTISAACKPKINKDGSIKAPAKLSATQDTDGRYQIELSELLRVFPAKSEVVEKATPVQETGTDAAIAELERKHLEEKLRDAQQRLTKAELERDQAVQDARDDRNKFMALLEHQKPKGLWARLSGK